jgi:putative transposase
MSKLIQRAYKTELNPNNKQITAFMQHAGCARVAWNWALARIKDKESEPNAMKLHKELNARKQEEFPYMYEVSKCSPQESLRDLQRAFKDFFAKRSKFPKFKSKNKGIGSFRLTGSIRAEEGRIKLPRIGWVKLKEKGYIPTDKHIMSVTISERAGKWFVSALVKEEIEQVETTDESLGIDLGIKQLATCSDGSSFDNPKALYKLEKKIKKTQRELSRKKNGSNRRKKCRQKLARLHLKVSNIRKDTTHKATSEIVKTKRPSVIVLEDLNVSGMVKNHNLAKSVYDSNMREFRNQIEYKSEWFGVDVQFVDRFFPSSKMCSNCGCIKEDLKLSDRIYKCDCGFEIDRDLNAAINLSNTASSAGINAHGDDKFHEPSGSGGRQRSENQTQKSNGRFC